VCLERSGAVGIESADSGCVSEHGTGQGIKLAGRDELVGVAERRDDPLPDRFPFARVLDNLQIGLRPDLLDPQEHGAPPCTTIISLISIYCKDINRLLLYIIGTT